MFKSYKEIFSAYVADLRLARDEAIKWWLELKRRVDSTPETDPKEALVRPRWPAGPCSHPRVLAVYRQYYLATLAYTDWVRNVIQARKSARLEGRPVGPDAPGEDYEATPSEVLLQWLDDEGINELAEFMTSLVMLPIDDPLPDGLPGPNVGALPAQFKFETIHRVPIRIERLMLAPRDLPPSAPWRQPPLALAQASPLHQQLFRDYYRDLENALRIAEKWWGGVIASVQARSADSHQEAVQKAYERFFAGPASLGVFLGVIHRYWMECVTLNARLVEQARVPPEVMLLHWLLDGRHESWVQCITCMPYWPIGLDDKGNWV
jgi:hypothetical protein